MNPRIETAVREARIRAEWYATGILDSGVDSRTGNTECIEFGWHYERLARDFHEERRSNLRNVRDEWRFFIERTGYAQRVTAGTALLDVEMPDWWQRVDPDQIDMSNKSQCICGLLGDGDWLATLERLMKPTDHVGWYEFAYTHGLVIDDDVSVNYVWDDEYGTRWDYLTDLWRQEVKERQQQAVSSSNL
jgi:hypothetical protein